jgi:hypothetical protein
MNVSNIKKFSNLQTNFMFHCYTQPIAGVFTAATDFTILARETSILAKTRDTINWRKNGRQTSLPFSISHDGEWVVTVNLDESAATYMDFCNWFYKVDQMKVNGTDYKSNAVIQLLNLDSSVTNTAFALIGIYPKTVPAVEGLNQENTEGHITFEMTFAVDDVAHGTVSGNTITWIESNVGYYPYKNILSQLTTIPITAGV